MTFAELKFSLEMRCKGEFDIDQKDIKQSIAVIERIINFANSFLYCTIATIFWFYKNNSNWINHWM